MYRRKFLTYASLAGVTSYLSACGGDADRPTLILWTMQLQPTFTEYIGGLVKQFALNENCTVEWVDIPWGDMETKILSAIASSTAPDVVNLNPQFALKLAAKGALWDINLPDSDRSSYFPRLWQANQLGEITFGLPWYVAVDVTLFNRQIFQQAGLEKAPRTFAELAISAQQIKAKTGKFAFLLTMDGGQLLETMVQMGMNLVDSQGKADFANAQGESAFAYWVNMFTQGLVPREILTADHRQSIELYQAGKTAMILSGAQFLRTITENAPDIAQVTDVSSQITGVTGKHSAAVMNLSVPKTSPQPELAVKLAQFLTNNPNQLEFAKIAQVLPSTVTASQDPYFRQVPDRAPTIDRARAISAQQLAKAEVLLPAIDGIDNLRKIIYAELQLAMLQRKSVQESVASAVQQWNSRRS